MEVKNLKLKKQSRCLEISFSQGTFLLSFEFLRVCHPKQAQQVISNKKNVMLKSASAVGNYALKLTFDDGYSALFSWSDLYEIACNKDKLWEEYCNKLKTINAKRSQLLDVTVKYH